MSNYREIQEQIDSMPLDKKKSCGKNNFLKQLRVANVNRCNKYFHLIQIEKIVRNLDYEVRT